MKQATMNPTINRADNPLGEDLDYVLFHTQGLWEELRGQRLFITGGTGFFGAWLLESFAWANDRLGLNAEVVVLTRNLEGFRQKAPHLANHPAISFHQGDVRSFEFPDGAFSHVIHAATDTGAKLQRENPLLMIDTIIQGTRRTLDFARQSGVQKFLLTSSGAVYGKQPPGMTHIPEDYAGAPDTMLPASAYGKAKRVAELLCAIYAQSYGLKTKVARCFAFLGPYLPLEVHFAIGNFIRDGLAGGPIQIKGDGTPYRSYLYAADLAVWLWTILLRGEVCRPYNVGSDREITIRDLAETVAAAFQPKLEVTIANSPVSGAQPERYVPSTRRALCDLNLKPAIGLQDAIQLTISWHQRRRNRVMDMAERLNFAQP